VSASRLSQAFGVAVRKARLRKGVSQERLAERAGLHPTYVGMIERGVRNATLDVAAKIADALDTPLPKLISISIRSTRATARGQCQMCGRTIERHGVSLALDYKIPHEWGGRNEDQNLWLICGDCSSGKAENFQHEKCALKWIGNIFANDIIRVGECRS
jgi:transcriptional regulator with XRE-family HTH domain